MDQKKLVLLRKICEEMTPLSATLRSEGEKTVLVIQLQPKTYRQMADEYHFDQEQRKMLEELIDSGLLDLFLEANDRRRRPHPAGQRGLRLALAWLYQNFLALCVSELPVSWSRTARRYRPACTPWHVHPGGESRCGGQIDL